MAAPNDILLLAAGEYSISSIILIQNLTIAAESLHTVTMGYNSSNPSSVGYNQTALTFVATNATVIGIAFSRFSTNAIIVSGASAKVSLIDCTFSRVPNGIFSPSKSDYYRFPGIAGCGIYSNQGSVNLLRVHFSGLVFVPIESVADVAVSGAAVYVSASSCASATTLTISNSTFDGSEAPISLFCTESSLSRPVLLGAMLQELSSVTGGYVSFVAAHCEGRGQQEAQHQLRVDSTVFSDVFIDAYGAAASHGGAIHVSGAQKPTPKLFFLFSDHSFLGPHINCTIIDSSFLGMRLVAGRLLWTGYPASGGAISFVNVPERHTEDFHLFESDLYIARSTFRNNLVYGGAISSDRDSAPGISYGSAGEGSGGAISIEGFVGISILSSSFVENNATGGRGGIAGGDGGGGAISFSAPINDKWLLPAKSPLVFINTTFERNNAIGGASFRALLDRGGSDSLGGAVRVFIGLGLHVPISFLNCSFSNNSAIAASYGETYGGAVAIVSSGGMSSERSTMFSGCRFLGNQVVGGLAYGGAVSYAGFLGGRHGVTFAESHFEENAALGGIEGEEISGNAKNLAPSPASDISEGGALYITFADTADTGTQSVLVSRSSFISNSAESSPVVFQPSPISTSQPSTGVGHARGGAIRISGGLDLDVEYSDFFINSALAVVGTAVSHGGAISARKLNLANSRFHYNHVFARKTDFGIPNDFAPSAVAGGAVFSDSLISAISCEFLGNSLNGSSARGGAIATFDRIFLQKSNFTSNYIFSVSGAAYGGAVSMILSANILDSALRQVISLCNFEYNAATVKLGSSEASFGGALSTALTGQPTLLATNFAYNSAEFGAAIFLSPLVPKQISFSPTYGFHDPTQSGGIVFIDSNIDLSGLLEHSGTRHHNATLNLNIVAIICNHSVPNYRKHMPFCATSVNRIVFHRPPPPLVWPGRLFSTSISVQDLLNTTALVPSTHIRISAFRADIVDADENHHSFNISDTAIEVSASASQIPSDDAHYEFKDLRVRLAPGAAVALKFASENFPGRTSVLNPNYRPTPDRFYQNPIGAIIQVSDCPPGFLLRNLSSGEFDCVPCPPGTYSLLGSLRCRSCSGLHSESRGGPDCLTPPQMISSDRDLWELQPGYFAVSDAEGEPLGTILQCPNRHACLGCNCSLVPASADAEIVKWSLNCSECGFVFNSSSQRSPCAEGYTDRLCSRCECDLSVGNLSRCFFATSGEEFVCRHCQAPSTAVLASAAVLICISLVAFLLFQHSTFAIFLAEVLIAVLLLVLGLGEWWFFDVILISSILFLVSRSATKRLNRRKHLSVNDEKKEKVQSAYFVGIVKISLFFLQTTSAVLPSDTWPKVVSDIVETLNSFSLRISGIECLFPQLHFIPAGKFMALMAAPLAVCIISHLSRHSGGHFLIYCLRSSR